MENLNPIELKNPKKVKTRVWRVGSVTTGVCLIAFGVLCLLHTFAGLVSYRVIFQLWPMVLVAMGVELLLSNLLCKKLIYDKGAIVLLVLLLLFALGMGCVDVSFGSTLMHQL